MSSRRQPARQTLASMARDLRFVCLGNDWSGHPSTLSLLFREIARSHHVIWINSIGQRAPRPTVRDIQRLFRKGLGAFGRSSPTPRLEGVQAVIEPRVIPLHRYGPVRALNAMSMARQVAPYVGERARVSLVAVTSNPAAVELIQRLQPALSVYYCLDDYAQMAECDAEMIRRCEPKMLQSVDCAFATSVDLCRRKNVPGRPVRHLPHGVDYEHFQHVGQCPAPLRAVPHPIIGFHGIVGRRLDLELLEKVARAFPAASVVTVGRREEGTRLKRYSNFHHFDAVSYEQLPSWVAQFDIGLVAYRRDGHTDAVNPLKLLEYLALGLPVVATSIPELTQHSRFVSLAHSHDQYLRTIGEWLRRLPLPDDERQARRTYAAGASWTRRAQQFVQTCLSLLDDKWERARPLPPRGMETNVR